MFFFLCFNLSSVLAADFSRHEAAASELRDLWPAWKSHRCYIKTSFDTQQNYLQGEAAMSHATRVRVCIWMSL